MILETLVLFVEFVVQMAFLFAALWIMIKIQKLNYNFPGLLGSAALVSGLDRALDTVLGHFLGNYLATYISAPVTLVVLIICIAKVTQADRVDVLFTIVVGYALMFGMNLWLFGALLGDLRPSAGNPGEFDTVAQQPETNKVYQTAIKTNQPVQSAHQPAPTVSTNAAMQKGPAKPVAVATNLFSSQRCCAKRLQFGGHHSNRKADLYYFARRIGLDADDQRPGFRAFQGIARWLGGADHQRTRNKIAVPLTHR